MCPEGLVVVVVALPVGVHVAHESGLAVVGQDRADGRALPAGVTVLLVSGVTAV